MVLVAPAGCGLAVLRHAVDLERDHEVDLHLARRLEHSIGDAVRSPDARIGRADGDAQVVEGHVPPRTCARRVGAAQGIGVRERAGLSGELHGGAQQDEGGEGPAFHIGHKVRSAVTLRWCAYRPQFEHHPSRLQTEYRRKAQMTLVKTPPPLSQEVDLSKTYDAVVVGSGAAGGMAAHVLTEQGMDVLMLEAGKKFDINQIGQELRSMQWPYDHPRRGDAPPGYHSLSFNEYTVRNPPYAKGSTFKHVMSYVGGWGGSDYVKNILVDEKDHPYTGTKYAWVRARALGGKTNIWRRLADLVRGHRALLRQGRPLPRHLRREGKPAPPAGQPVSAPQQAHVRRGEAAREPEEDGARADAVSRRGHHRRLEAQPVPQQVLRPRRLRPAAGGVRHPRRVRFADGSDLPRHGHRASDDPHQLGRARSARRPEHRQGARDRLYRQRHAQVL